MPRPTKAVLPNKDEQRVLAQIAQSYLQRTNQADRAVPIWTIGHSGREIANGLARRLIEKGWVLPNRDGLGRFDMTQTYVALKPAKAAA